MPDTILAPSVMPDALLAPSAMPDALLAPSVMSDAMLAPSVMPDALLAPLVMPDALLAPLVMPDALLAVPDVLSGMLDASLVTPEVERAGRGRWLPKFLYTNVYTHVHTCLHMPERMSVHTRVCPYACRCLRAAPVDMPMRLFTRMIICVDILHLSIPACFISQCLIRRCSAEQALTSTVTDGRRAFCRIRHIEVLSTILVLATY